MGSAFFKHISFALLNTAVVTAAIVLGNGSLPAEAFPGGPFLGGVADTIRAYDIDEGKKHPAAKVLNRTQDGGQDDRDSDGNEKMTTCTIPILTMYPPTMNVQFQTGSVSKGMLEQYLKCVAHNGTLISDSKASAVQAYASEMMARIIGHPSNQAQMAKAQTLGNTQAASDAMGDASKAQASSAIDYNTRYLQNFTSDIGNRWNQIRLNLFVPIALLLLVPGAVLAQMKAVHETTGPRLEYVLPFEGIGRSLIAVFAIGASSLVPNYAIDFANSVTDGIASGYQSVVGSNMYEDAIAFQVRGTPVRTPKENQNAGNAPRWPQGAINSIATFEKSMVFNKKEDSPGQDQADPDRTNEAMPAGAAMSRFAAFGLNSALTATWNILCAFQQAYLAYLFLIGPIACALWVWPIDQFRQAMPNWIEGCITICFWNLFWNTVILLMACFRGTDTTNTLIMTALNFLATASVKYAFDFASLVKNAGEQAAQQAMQGAGGSHAGGKSSHAAGGKQHAGGGIPHGHGAKHPLHHGELAAHRTGQSAGVEGAKPGSPFRPALTHANWEPGPGRNGYFANPNVGEPPSSLVHKASYTPGGAGEFTPHGGDFGSVRSISAGSNGGAEAVTVGSSSASSFGEGAAPVAFLDMPGGTGELPGSAQLASFTGDAPQGALLDSPSGAFFGPGAHGGLTRSPFEHPVAHVPGPQGGPPVHGSMDVAMPGQNGAPGGSIALQTADGHTLFFAPGQNGEPGMVLSPNATGGFDSALVNAAGGIGGIDGGDTFNINASTAADGNGWDVSYTNNEGDVDNFQITAMADGAGYSVGQTFNGQDMGHSDIGYANGNTTVSEFGPGQVSPSAVHAYMADGSATSSYYSLGSTTPDLTTTTHPITVGDNTGYQTNYYGRDSADPTGSVRHIDNANGGWTEAAYGRDGQPLSVSNQTINNDGTYTIGTQQFNRDGAVASNDQAVYSMDNNYLQSISSEVTSPDMTQVMSSNAYFDSSQELVSANAISYENGMPVSSTDFGRDSNNNYLERQTSFDQYGGVTGVVQAAFDPSGQLLGGQVNYNNSNVSEVAISRVNDGEYYARQSSVSGETVSAHLAYDASQNSWNTVQDNSFSSAQSYNVTAQDAYGTPTVQQQQSGDVINQGTEGPPVVQHLPNADAMVQQTIASIEQLAAYWFDQRMQQHQNAAEVKPLEPVFASPIETFGQSIGPTYHAAALSSYSTSDGAINSYASPAIENAAYTSSASFEQANHAHHIAPPENIRYEADDQTSYPAPAVENNYQTEVSNYAHHAPPPEIVAREYGEATVYPVPSVENNYTADVPHTPRPTPPIVEPPPPDSYQQNYSNTYRNSVQSNSTYSHDARQNAIYNSIMGIQNTPIKTHTTPPPTHNPDTIKKIIDDLKNAAGEKRVEPKESDTWQSWAEW
jgi:hypothetical protein